MTDLKRATEAPDFVVDDDRGALLNTNNRALMGYRAQRDEVRKAHNMCKRIEKLESSIDDIKELLIKALNK